MQFEARASPPIPAHHRGGRAALRFTQSPDGPTFIARQRVAYPFHVTRAFYVEQDPEGMLTLYLQSVSGGVFADDRLELEMVAQANAQAHVTTQASTIVHSMPEASALQTVQITVEPGALFEFLPDPLILFPQANLESRVHARVDENATFLVCDAYTGHDPAGGDGRFGRLKSEIRVERPDGSVLFVDRLDVDGVHGLEGLTPGASAAHGIVCCVPAGAPKPDALLSRLRTALDGIPGLYAGASSLPSKAGVWARLVADDAHALRTGITAAWSALREVVVGQVPRPRRK